jgi:hypothetical protein
MNEKPNNTRSRARWWILAAALVFATGAIITVLGKDAVQTLVRHSPYHDDGSFHRAIGGADRIVVRAGGFDCCGSIKNDTVLFSITNPSTVAEVAAHIRFEPITIANSFMESCLCCGYPGVDWYRGTKRIAITAMQHGRGVRWKGFTTARFLGMTIGYGDLPLTAQSQQWLRNWFEAHGVPTKDSAPARIG